MMKKYGWMLLLLFAVPRLKASEIFIGKASADITPKLPVALMGQFHLRIAQTAETPLTVNIIAMEDRENGKTKDMVVFVSCDLLYIPNSLRTMVRSEVNKQLPLLDSSKIILSATHTHTAPVLEDEPGQYSFLYPIPAQGVTQVKDYVAFIVKRISNGVVTAWNTRKKGSVAWGVERAVVGYNRRSVYKDGTSVLYGKTDVPEFQNLEGYEDHDVNSLFFLNADGSLAAIAVEVACPAQEVESRNAVNADYWHPVRKALKKQYGEGIVVLSWNGASGDLSPHRMYRKEAMERMMTLRKMTAMDDIAKRIVHAIDETYKTVKQERHTAPVFAHKVTSLDLPVRPITEVEYQAAQEQYKTASDAIAAKPAAAAELLAQATWHKGVVNRYEQLKTNPSLSLSSEVHVLRIGDVAICSNQFELFTDYSVRVQARSKALQTIVVQLAGAGTYLATAKAMQGGGYSAICESNIVGAEGGQLLVDRTVEMINEMWK